MGRNTVFRSTVHVVGADLYLKWLPGRPHKRSMQGLIHVRLRHGDIVLKPSGNGLIHLMDYAQSRITISYRIHNDPNGKQVIDLIQRLSLIYHLLIDTEKMLCPPVNAGFNSCIINMLAHFLHQLLNILLPYTLTNRHLFHQIIVGFRMKIFQRQVIQFNFNLGNTKTLGKRTVYFLRFPGDTLLALRGLIFQRPHIVQPVRQLDHDNPDILGHSQEHFSQVLRLHFQTVRRLILLSSAFLRQMEML